MEGVEKWRLLISAHLRNTPGKDDTILNLQKEELGKELQMSNCTLFKYFTYQGAITEYCSYSEQKIKFLMFWNILVKFRQVNNPKPEKKKKSYSARSA